MNYKEHSSGQSVLDSTERRRIQNREAQRRFRENAKKRLQRTENAILPELSLSNTLSMPTIDALSRPNDFLVQDKLHITHPSSFEAVQVTDFTMLAADPSLCTDSCGPPFGFEGIPPCDLNLAHQTLELTSTSISEQESETGRVSMLHIAAQKGFVEIMQILIANGINLEVKNDAGQTALHIAACYGRLDIIHVLLDAGLDVDILDAQDQTALFEAVRSGHEDCVKVLVKYGANVHTKALVPDL